MSNQQVAIIGGGWAGLAAAVFATQAGHRVSVFEAAPQWGGRARTAHLAWPAPGGGTRTLALDNGQHILIGAYSACFALMRFLGEDPLQAFARLPLALRFPDGTGLALPDWPSPLDAGWGIATAKGWPWRDKLGLLRTAARWQRMGFACPPDWSVARLCEGLSPRLMTEFIDPLCVSALNTPAAEASGQIFLNVLRDSLMGTRAGSLGASNLMLPRRPMGALWCDAAASWLAEQGASLHLGQPVQQLQAGPAPGRWQVNGQPFDAVILATNAAPAARLVESALKHMAQASPLAPTAPETPHVPHEAGLPSKSASSTRHASPPDKAAWRAMQQTMAQWQHTASALRYEAITTVYAQIDEHQPAEHGAYHLPMAMLALRATPQHPAQFVFERDRLHADAPPSRALAFVLSASRLDRDALTQAVRAQALAELGLPISVQHVLTDKRATFCCTPGLQRPGTRIAAGLLACGDYIEGPYPATLEGAVRSAQTAVAALSD